jgi:amino acid transporter
MQKEKKFNWLKTIFIGKARDIHDDGIFHKLSLAAILAWVGLGSDGLSSSCYGPEETMKVLVAHPALAMLVALASVITIGVICISYSQIIELFPSGGGGYLVASKLLSPTAGVVSGSALLVDYVLTIAISVAAGADALFSVLPEHWLPYKMTAALAATLVLILMNLRGIKESVIVWAPIFFIFLATHSFAVLYGFFSHTNELAQISADAVRDVSAAHQELGTWNVALLLLTAYSLGAGSYTGIEAVSNGLPILREPKVATGRRTMVYMGISLAFMVGGLLLMYQLYKTLPKDGMTMNAVLFAQMTEKWPPVFAQGFVWVSMFSAAALLFIAAQTGFLDGPRVLSSMAVDRWLPARFATLSDRFVSQNGILLMGGAALLLIWVSKGSVGWLVVLYSINVFVTFSLSQLGMVVHWSREHSDPKWRRKLVINLVGFLMTATILIALSVIKFHEGGWITILVTGSIVALAFAIRIHYRNAHDQLSRLDSLVEVLGSEAENIPKSIPPCDPQAKTAVVFVNGFNGLGIHTTLAVQKMFPGVFKNFIFVEIGVVDAGNFKGATEIDHLQKTVEKETRRYTDYMNSHGIHAESLYEIGTDIVETARDLADRLAERFPNVVFFGGQIVFKDENYFTRVLHNFAVFGLQRSFFQHGLPFFVLPVRV